MEKDLQPSLSWQETISSRYSSNAAILLEITRNDCYRVDVLYLVFQLLLITLLYHEVYALECRLFQLSFTLSISSLYKLMQNN